MARKTATANAPCSIPGPSKSKYRPEIDGLRAFAVIAVIINHFNKNLLPSGYLGVDIFFVISGYVITSSLAGRDSKNFLGFLSGFYERRIKRLVPTLVVFVLITSILISLFNPEPSVVLGVGWRSLLGISNIHLYWASTDYFAQSTELNPFTHTWSLGVEEQFYLLFPFLVWFSGFARQSRNGARNLFLWIGALTVASLTGFIYLYQTNQPAAYFLMPPRFWELAAGCLIFIGFQKRAKIEQALEHVPPLLVVSAMIGVMFLPNDAAVPATISIVVLSAILIACLKSGTAAFSAFTNERVVFIGLISYSLYLWHWGVLSISRWTIGIHWWSAPFQVILMLLVGSTSYAVVERPLRSISSRQKNIPLVCSAGLVTIVLTASLVAALKLRISGVSSSTRLYLLANPGTKLLTMNLGKGEILRELASEYAPRWEDNVYDEGTSRFAKCLFSKTVSDADFKSCARPSLEKQNLINNIYIFGDSHAANYAFGIRKAFPGRVSMVTVGSGCGYLSLKDAKKLNSVVLNCSDYVVKVNNFVATLGKGDIIVLGNDWRESSSKRNSLLQENTIRNLAELSVRRGAKFVLLDDVPPLGDPLLSMRRWYRPFTKSISNHQVDNDLAGLDAIGERLAKGIHGAMYLSLRKGLCSANQCSNEMGEKLIYFDSGHITVEASEGLAPEVKRQLEAFIKS